MATVSFTMATTSISKSCGGGSRRCHAPRPAVPRGPRGMRVPTHTRARTHTRVHSTPPAPLPGDPRDAVGTGGGHRRTQPARGQRPSHPSPFDGVSQEPDHVVPFRSGGFEALGPVQQDALGRGRTERGSVGPWGRHRGGLGSRAALPAPHLVDVLVPHGEGEGEAQGQLFVLHLMLVQEVGDALGDVVEELGESG